MLHWSFPLPTGHPALFSTFPFQLNLSVSSQAYFSVCQVSHPAKLTTQLPFPLQTLSASRLLPSASHCQHPHFPSTFYPRTQIINSLLCPEFGFTCCLLHYVLKYLFTVFQSTHLDLVAFVEKDCYCCHCTSHLATKQLEESSLLHQKFPSIHHF